MGRIRNKNRLCLCLLLFLWPFGTQQALAFDGDYIWEDRFKASLVEARSGLAKDQYAVADMYFRGRGTTADAAKALHWFLLAARQGHRKAAYKVGYLYLYGDGLTHSPRLALPWIKKAAIAGYAPAQHELGKLYFSGRLGKRNEAQALKWLGKAKAAGYAPARSSFDRLVKRLVKANAGRPSHVVPAKKRPSGPKGRPDVVADSADPKSIILHSKWGGRDGPSTFLPSLLTNCSESAGGIECLSSRLDMQLASTHVVYRTRTKITDIRPDGQFRLAYANNVLSTDAKPDSSGATIKTGWQRNEHVLDCSLVAGRTISCAQGTRKQYRFFGR